MTRRQRRALLAMRAQPIDQGFAGLVEADDYPFIPVLDNSGNTGINVGRSVRFACVQAVERQPQVAGPVRIRWRQFAGADVDLHGWQQQLRHRQ